MYNCFYKFLVKNNILYQKEFGFQNSILQLVNQIKETNKGRYILAILIDRSKAFDTVNDNIVLEKFKAYGI